ncbi:hypothetical protein Thiowin_04602 [Thiorhodovibrio winogradskyi]|uniref:Uncharacterized protein n=1 Tax=Thiorhodovibrio winogradskyi TaxID=77007 RepID=A0ABZ0SFN2_9GAMM
MFKHPILTPEPDTMGLLDQQFQLSFSSARLLAR